MFPSYADLEHIQITDEQYMANIIHQHRDFLTPDFLSLFARITNGLVKDIQMLILGLLLDFRHG